jgi:hypothetical protein
VIFYYIQFNLPYRSPQINGHLCLTVTLRPAQLILLYLFNGHLSNAANGLLFPTFAYMNILTDYFNEPQWTLFTPIQLFIRISFYLCLFNWLRWAFSFRIQVIVIYQLHWFWPFMITFRIPFHYSDIYFSYLIYIFPYTV